MVASTSSCTPAEPVTRSKNRVRDFFWPGGDCAGKSGPQTRTVAGESDWFVYDACRGPALPHKEDDCGERRQRLLKRKEIAQNQSDLLNSRGDHSIADFQGEPRVTDIAGATGLISGTADGLATFTGYNTTPVNAISLFTFAIGYGDAVGTAVGEGIYGTPESYGQALGEVVRQGFIFTGSAAVGHTMVKVPTPVTIIGGLVLIAGDMAISGFMNHVDAAHAYDLRQIHKEGRQDMRFNLFEGVGRLNADIMQWNKDCAGSASE